MDGEKIIGLFFERSEQAIRELDAKYGKLLHRLSRNIVSSAGDTEECVNDTYLGAWNAIPPARPNPVLANICKIVRNLSLKCYYRKAAEKRGGSETEQIIAYNFHQTVFYCNDGASCSGRASMAPICPIKWAIIPSSARNRRASFWQTATISHMMNDIVF